MEFSSTSVSGETGKLSLNFQCEDYVFKELANATDDSREEEEDRDDIPVNR